MKSTLSGCPAMAAALRRPPLETARELALARRVKAKRCHCGLCDRCLDNARWKKIFQEKFADPNYYSPLPVPHGSSLRGAQEEGI
jgi:hypothetical protein